MKPGGNGQKSDYFPCRCKYKNKCGYRVTLRQPLDWFETLPVCGKCGGPLILDQYRIDQRKLPAAQRKDNPVCLCAAAPGRRGENRPHRPGSMVTCERYGVPF